MREIHTYSAFGLTLRSELACPEFLPGHGEADARLRFGNVPEHLPPPVVRGVTFEGKPQQVLLRFPGIGRFLVENGTEITFEPHPSTTDDTLRVFLTGAALGVLLLQRGTLVLHAATCASAKGAVVLAGSSGRGKSTLLAALLARGHAMLADDLSAVGVDADRSPVVHPAFSRVKLFPDSVDRLGWNEADYAPVRPSIAKLSVPVPDAFSDRPRRIAGIYILDYGGAEGVVFTPLAGQERLAAIRAHVYSRRLAEGLRLNAAHFATAAAVASQVPIVHLSRPRGLAFVDRVVEEIEGRSL